MKCLRDRKVGCTKRGADHTYLHSMPGVGAFRYSSLKSLYTVSVSESLTYALAAARPVGGEVGQSSVAAAQTTPSLNATRIKIPSLC